MSLAKGSIMLTNKVMMYTDGAAIGNPGPGGYGVVLLYNNHRKELSGGYRLTTNNRMELLALIKGLESLKTQNLEVHIYTDSKYVSDSIEKKWVFTWAKKNFKNKKNSDLWKQFLLFYPLQKIQVHWVKGHSGIKENERCDQLATAAAQNTHLLIDEEYENEKETPDNSNLF